MFQKLNELRLLSFFLENPFQRVYLRELARKLGMSPATVLRGLRSLTEYELITQDKQYRGSLFRANSTPYFKALKIAYSLEKLQQFNIVNEIVNNANGLITVMIFGSTAKGEDTPESDLDLLIIANKVNTTAGDISKKIGREVSLHVYSVTKWKETREKNKAFYWDVISHGIALHGQKLVI